MNTIRSYLKNNRGQAFVEFALILPFLLVVIGGVVDFGLALFIGHVIENAAREGARSGAVIPPAGPVAETATFPACQASASVVLSTACSAIPNVGLFNGFTVTSSGVTGATPNQEVRVTVTGTYSWFLLKLLPSDLPLLGQTGFPSGPITITRSATMRWEWQI